MINEFQIGDQVRVYDHASEFYDHLGEVKQVTRTRVSVVLNIHKTLRTTFTPMQLEPYNDPRNYSTAQYRALVDNWEIGE